MVNETGLAALVEMSNRYGADENYVLAGGGNTSFKENGVMYVKGSGTRLSDITAERFVPMDLNKLLLMTARKYPPELGDDEREEQALAELMAARLPGNESGRPSVESALHALFPYKYVLHTHPALVNGMTCGRDGEKVSMELFGKDAVWVGAEKPGLILAAACKKAFGARMAETGQYPQIAFLQNHGVFAAADSVGETDEIMGWIFSALKGHVADEPDFSEAGFDAELACSLAPALRMLYSRDGRACAVFCTNKQVKEFVSGKESFDALIKPFTPDHIVYSGDEPLFIEQERDIEKTFETYRAAKGRAPKIAAVCGLGFFALGPTRAEAENARILFLDSIRIAVYARLFGGIRPMPDELAAFISNWEVERYRAGQLRKTGAGRLDGKIALITGGAQGFGKGIAEELAAEGAYIAVADLNAAGAEKCAEELNKKYGAHRAAGVKADVSDEESVKRMVRETVLEYGGLDVLISNAGVLTAGGLGEMTKEKFDFVTSVNYTGYFLCAKYAAEIMKAQRKFSPEYMADIIEINSKSGLEGSNKNFAYSGSKFGGIGLTQSFALELVGYGVKVNAVCPGSFFDGPMWSDPERGLFRQYLDSGKVPGAKTTDDVRRFYEAKVPMGRGCEVRDVVRAILYIIEQEYETGQAVPVTGGQVMLN